jgi:pimeloyl-ACP methyl ester carboxylesterase
MRVDGRLVRFRAVGDGPPVLLVHGLGGSPRWWTRTTRSLAEAHRVILPELPGFGLGLPLGGGAPFRLAEAPDILRELIDRLAIGRAGLVGHSLGALACAGVAARAPEVVHRLVLIAPPVRTAGAGLLGNALPAVRTLLGLPLAAAVTVATDIASRSPLALLRAAGELLVTEHARELARVLVPTLLLWGSRDVLVPASGAAELAELVPGAQLRLIPGAGHVPMLDRPDDLTRELRDFLAA